MVEDIATERLSLYGPGAANFNDDARAFAGIPARHDAWRGVPAIGSLGWS